MDRPTIGNTEAVFQAGLTVKVYLNAAVEMLDNAFGDGYAQDHPELVAACIKAQGSDFNYCAVVAALYELADAIVEQGTAL